MRRFARWSALLLAALLGLAAMLLAVALLGANTAIGREALVWLIPRLTSGEVRVRGIAGHLPGAPRVRRLTLADASGPYLTARGVALDWRPLRLLRGAIAIDRLAAAEVRVLRIPGGSGSAPGQSMPVAVRAFSISRLDLVPAIAGKEARLAVHGAFAEDADGTTAITVAAHRLGEPGSYHVEARFDPRTVSVKARFGEPAGGLLARLAGLPDLGPIRLTASLAGPRDRIATDLVLGAGALIAHAHGEIDLTHRSADLAVDATAPAMRPRADIAWRRIAFHARLAGKFAAPRLAGQLDIASLMAAGGEIGRIAATVSGTRGAARLHATLSGILLPMSGPGRALLAAAPLTVTAGLDFAARGRPLSLRFAHPLIAGRITGTTEGQRNLAAT
ncbi:MAG: hypothetical protein KGI51_05090, partial [Rhodospirillales bacterium]|nr:hypothetical protein [Rhodospirillales bacterium]